jgi:hypothetical protein
MTEEQSTEEAPSLRESLEDNYNEQVELESAVEEYDEVVDESEAEEEAVQEVDEDTDEQEELEDTEVGAELPETIEELYIPKDWSEDEQEAYRQFAKADKESADKISARFKNMHSGFHEKSQEYADYKKKFEGLEGIVEPLRHELSLKGMTVEGYINSLVGWDREISNNPREAINKLAQNIGLDLTEFTEDYEDDYSDPKVSKLEAKLKALEQNITQQEQSRLNAESESLQKQVENFEKETDASGELAHPHFAKVRATMSALYNANPSDTLEQLYDKAVRAEGLEIKTKPVKTQADKRKEIAQAKKKSKSVSTTRVKGSTEPVKPKRSLREDLEEKYNEAVNS